MKVESLIPVLDVRDVDASISFYCEVLEFRLQDKVEWAGRTEWALLNAGQVQLMLCANGVDPGDEEYRVNDGIFFLNLDNPEALIVRLNGAGIPNVAPPEAKLGNKDFYLRDPDGYILWFSHRAVVKDAPPPVDAAQPTSFAAPGLESTAKSTVTPAATSVLGTSTTLSQSHLCA